LGALLGAYCDFLEIRKKASAPKVRKALTKHVHDASPALWNKPAGDLDVDDLASLVRPLVDSGHLREAAKIRSYLQAAYAAAVSARQGVNGSPALRELKISRNPAKDLSTVDAAGSKRQRVLSESELRAYWQAISAIQSPGGALLRFHLLTGCQRIEQLARLKATDVDSDRPSFKIYDPKGRRKTPRMHEVPLIPVALTAIDDMELRLGPYVASIDHGTSGAEYSSYRHRLQEIVRGLLAAEKLPGGSFSVGDLRRTVETRLAAAGVSLEVRAQLQSHGLGGVQARHYDKHDYFSEKLDALKKLATIMAI
jgi:integrase